MMETKRMNQQCSSFKVTTASILIVALFAFMFASAGYLLYRIALIQSHFTDLSFSTNRYVLLSRYNIFFFFF